MDDQRLREIKERCERASKGDWDIDKDAVYKTSDGKTICICFFPLNNHFENYQANAEFIAHARQDVPDLVAEVEEFNLLKRRLVSVEWIGIYEEKYCPACKEHIKDGHELKCWLGKALGRV